MRSINVFSIIETYASLINNKKWEELYDYLEKDPSITPQDIGDFTQTLLDAGINPLELGLDGIPYDFLSYLRLTSFVIPNNITSIGDSAFYDCSDLTRVTIGNGVESIGSYAFQYCSSLKNVTIPNSVTSIGNYVFYKCPQLTSITYNGTKEEWGNIKKNEAWNYSSSLKTIKCIDGDIELNGTFIK